MNDWFGSVRTGLSSADGWTIPRVETVHSFDGITVVQSAPWLFGTICTVGIILVALGWLFRRELGRLGLALCLVTGSLLLVVLAPGALLDIVTLCPDGVRVTHVRWVGECLEPAHFELDFAGLQQLEMVEHQRAGLFRAFGSEAYLVGRSAQGEERWLPVTRLVRPVLTDVQTAAKARQIAWVDRYDRWLTSTANGGPATAAETR